MSAILISNHQCDLHGCCWFPKSNQILQSPTILNLTVPDTNTRLLHVPPSLLFPARPDNPYPAEIFRQQQIPLYWFLYWEDGRESRERVRVCVRERMGGFSILVNFTPQTLILHPPIHRPNSWAPKSRSRISAAGGISWISLRSPDRGTMP